MSFKDKIVIITGAASGVGAAAAYKFSENLAHVVLVDKNNENLTQVANKCKNSFPIHADISNDDDVRRIVGETINKYNRIDILINSAGIAKLASILDGDILDTFSENIGVNLRGPIHITKLVAPYLIKSKGNIVNISSIAPQSSSVATIYSTYTISKAGLNSFSTLAASELAPHGVRVNAISPGAINTNILKDACVNVDDMIRTSALNRLLEAEEVADLILFLASEKAKGITGSNIVADNGMLLRNN